MVDAMEGQAPTILRRSDGPALAMSLRLGGGGEGEVFAVDGDATHVVKVYRRPTDERADKLTAMLQAMPDDPQRANRNHVSICWPEDLVSTPEGRVVGFLMPRLDTTTCGPVGLFWN